MEVLGSEVIKPAHFLSMEAHKQYQQHYITKKHMDVSIFAFPGSWEVKDWYDDDDCFGETNVDQTLFPSLLRIGEDRLAKLNKAFLQRFQNLLNNSGFKSELEKVLKEDKKILFTGHSSGGAIASLATLWMLDEYARKQKVKIPIGCVTFGSPLIGDGTLAHAVRREKWSGHFTHFVMEHDIVPRIMLTLKTSIQQHLPNILKSFQQKVNPVTTHKSIFPDFFTKKTPKTPSDNDPLVKPDEAVAFFENVLINSSTVASYDAFDLMEPTNSLKEKLSADYVKVSPYRPFGDYVFCTRDETQRPRQQLVVENPNAVLQLLFYFLQLPPNEHHDLAEFALNSLAESISYEEELNKIGWQFGNKIFLKNLNKHLLTSNGTTGDAVRTANKALYELNASAKWCLLAVEESEKRKKENEDHIKKSMRKYKSNNTQKIIEDILEEIRKYKIKYDDGKTDYYEAFKHQEKKDDFVANGNRLEQAKIWDEVVEMVMRKDLPDEFEVWGELVNLATKFRYLVEPLDIANYYRHLKGDGYMAVRPKRYKFSQRWYEHANVMKFEPVSESNFVAEVEELMKEVEKPKNRTLDKIKEELEILKSKVQNWRSDKNTPKDYVFWGESILSMLQEKLTEKAG